ncbi:MAG: type II toxin-antitoxin system HipA family toxin [Coriobacteriales bacterium]|jgi:serine/threonine-protein kinase HipA|nr:type II toxin-antitoxin system HipA family toxin [Coriobacteriales bacterium]
MPHKSTESIEVSIWGQPVGVLAFDPGSGVYAFEYYEGFKRLDWELAPLTVPLSTQGPVSFPHLPVETFFGLPAFIADSLPDAFGNALIDRWMAVQGVRKEEITPLDRLAYLGKRGMGALEFRPALKTGDAKPAALEMSDLVEAVRRVLSVELWRDNDPIWGMPADEDDAALPSELARLIAVGTSAGGARAKAVVGYSEQADAFLSGQFDLPEGYRHWIIKFDVASVDKVGSPHDYGRVEYAYYLMARSCGIEMAPSRLYEAGGRAHFMTRRFDRVPVKERAVERRVEQGVERGSGKLHMQTLCGMAQMDYKQRGVHDYNQLFMVLDELGLGYRAVDQMFLRMVFNVCAANNDDHTKNHSFLMDSEGVWALAPAYDLTHAYRKDSLWVSRHLMSVNGRFEGIERADLLSVARQFQVAAPQRLIEDALTSMRHWPEFAGQAGVSEEATHRIQSDIEEFSALVV